MSLFGNMGSRQPAAAPIYYFDPYAKGGPSLTTLGGPVAKSGPVGQGMQGGRGEQGGMSVGGGPTTANAYDPNTIGSVEPGHVVPGCSWGGAVRGAVPSLMAGNIPGAVVMGGARGFWNGSYYQPSSTVRPPGWDGSSDVDRGRAPDFSFSDREKGIDAGLDRDKNDKDRDRDPDNESGT
jgi:hypothetical protein